MTWPDLLYDGSLLQCEFELHLIPFITAHRYFRIRLTPNSDLWKRHSCWGENVFTYPTNPPKLCPWRTNPDPLLVQTSLLSSSSTLVRDCRSTLLLSFSLPTKNAIV
ncbi:hypothetical protein KC19_1G215600 [Ceratodon purpureus]|uniref:Uncharacterized protein n=1 Tax=Ceratodon purpureus TaxID=3225 RepID=A0A8T0J8Z0_CERPU|nr:hypothetical protein KC19_1G215600 [Ceratodon purpureus]